MEDELFECRRKIMREIAELRKEKGISQVEMSKYTPYTPHRICDIESGRHNVTLDTVNTILNVLGAKLTIEKL